MSLFVRQILNRTTTSVLSHPSFFNASRYASFWRHSSSTSSPQQEQQTETTTENPNPIEEKSDVEMKRLTDENVKLTDNLNEFKDRYKRALAETENTRIRFNKMIADAKIFGIQGFCKDLLEVADILNLAITNTPKQQTNENLAKDFANLYQGLIMTEEKMQKIFAKNGLLPIRPNEGDKFDPNFHDALFQTKIPDRTSGSIIQVMKTGYRLHDRVIRAAQVGVAQ